MNNPVFNSGNNNLATTITINGLNYTSTGKMTYPAIPLVNNANDGTLCVRTALAAGQTIGTVTTVSSVATVSQSNSYILNPYTSGLELDRGNAYTGYSVTSTGGSPGNTEILNLKGRGGIVTYVGTLSSGAGTDLFDLKIQIETTSGNWADYLTLFSGQTFPVSNNFYVAYPGTAVNNFPLPGRFRFMLTNTTGAPVDSVQIDGFVHFIL